MRTKRAFQIKSIALFIIFKKLSMKQITEIFLEGENPTLICIKIATLPCQRLQ